MGEGVMERNSEYDPNIICVYENLKESIKILHGRGGRRTGTEEEI